MFWNKIGENMYPKICDQSNIITSIINEKDFGNIIKTITTFDCSRFFTTHLSKNQSDQKKVVLKFQQELFEKLQNNLSHIKWDLEYHPDTKTRDSIDIHGLTGNNSIVIEIDKHRADQVAKKFLSRSAMLQNSLLYVALCIPGTSKMNPNECIKYFKYCSVVSEKIHNMFMGLIVETNK